jgi:hypothetical protein
VKAGLLKVLPGATFRRKEKIPARKDLIAWCCLRKRPDSALFKILRHWALTSYILSVGSGSGYLENEWMNSQPDMQVFGVDVVPCNRFLDNFLLLPRGIHVPRMINTCLFR